MSLNNGFAAPSVDIYENGDEFLVVADLPGARSESVEVRLDKENLSISARREAGADGGGEYRRTFLVPRGIDASQITAEMKQGVLTLRLPKGAALKPRTIQVKPAN